MVDGKEVEVRPELYTWGYPVISVDYPASRCDVRFDSLPDQETLKSSYLMNVRQKQTGT